MFTKSINRLNASQVEENKSVCAVVTFSQMKTAQITAEDIQITNLTSQTKMISAIKNSLTEEVNINNERTGMHSPQCSSVKFKVQI